MKHFLPKNVALQFRARQAKTKLMMLIIGNRLSVANLIPLISSFSTIVPQKNIFNFLL